MTVRNIETLRFIGVGSLFASAAGLVMMLGLEFQIANSAKADDDLPPTPGTVVENCGQAVNSQGENAGCPANTLGKKCKKGHRAGRLHSRGRIRLCVRNPDGGSATPAAALTLRGGVRSVWGRLAFAR